MLDSAGAGLLVGAPSVYVGGPQGIGDLLEDRSDWIWLGEQRPRGVDRRQWGHGGFLDGQTTRMHHQSICCRPRLHSRWNARPSRCPRLDETLDLGLRGRELDELNVASQDIEIV